MKFEAQRRRTRFLGLLALTNTLILTTGLIAPALAGEVDDLTTFTAGTPARAAEINGNFQMVKTAVDDNHARLTAVESSLQVAGAVSINTHGFSEFFNNNRDSVGCQFRRLLNHGYFENTSGSCIATAPVDLPHGSSVTGLSCLVHDEAAGWVERPNLVRMSLVTAQQEIVLDTNTLTDDSGLQTLSSRVLQTDARVDNAAYAYFISVRFLLTDAVPGQLRIYACSVQYAR